MAYTHLHHHIPPSAAAQMMGGFAPPMPVSGMPTPMSGAAVFGVAVSNCMAPQPIMVMQTLRPAQPAPYR